MAANTVAVWEGALKQGWTQDRLEKQFYDGDPLLDAIEAQSPEEAGGQTLGLEAITPIQTGHGGGYSVAPPSGSSELNSADAEDISQAKWKYRRHYTQIELDTAVVEQSKSSSVAVASAADSEIEGKIGYTRKQITRQLFGDQSALIAQCEVTSASTKVNLLKTGFGYQALRNGYLPVGQEIDIGTKGNEKLRAAKKRIESVEVKESAPVLVLGEAITTAETDYVSIAKARSGETSYECNGLRNIISESTTLGGIAPATVPGWIGTVEEAKKAPISRNLVLGLKRKVRQLGETPDWAVTSLRQVEALEGQIYAQVRFSDPAQANTGDGESVMVGNLKVQGHLDCPETDFHMLTKKHLSALRTNKPEWMPEKYGKTGILQWRQNTTFLVSGLEYFFEVFTNRRNAHGRIAELA